MSTPRTDATLTSHQTMLVRHYGDPAFDRAKFLPITDRQFIKPQGGLWTSPITSKFGWKDWCIAEDFCSDFSVFFDVKFTGNVLTIDTLPDLQKLPWVDASEHWRFPLFQPLLLMGVDAIHLTARGQWATRLTHPYSLYGWDCETVLILNPDTLTTP